MRDDLRNARKAKGLTQVELAELVGVRQSDVSRIENGKRQVDTGLAPTLADVLGMPVLSVLYPDRAA